MDSNPDSFPDAGVFAESCTSSSCSPNASSYGHEALEGDMIRLLKIEPGALADPIACTTEAYSLREVNFSALSYTWGSMPSSHKIYLNGAWFGIRKNLWRFLQEARKRSNTSHFRLLWIDALCINQFDNQERTHQVNMMPEIYRNAQQVIVWLGPAYNGGDEAMKYLSKMKMPVIAKKARKTARMDATMAVSLLSRRPYWKRLWIVQEITLAKKILVMCGNGIAPWEPLRRLLLERSERAAIVSAKEHKAEDHIVYGSPAIDILAQTQLQVDQRNLFTLMNITRDLQCTELRDKVYALLGISTRGGECIEADYNTPLPVLLNAILRNHHRIQAPDDPHIVAEQYQRLASMLGVDHRYVFHPVDQPDRPPAESITLEWALTWGHSAVERILVQQDAHIVTEYLSKAIYNNSEADVRLILHHSVTTASYVRGEALLKASSNDQPAIVRMLLERGTQIDLAPYAGVALHRASRSGLTQVVRMLLEHGIHANSPGGDMREWPQMHAFGTALQEAAYKGHSEIVQMLLDGGGDTDAPDADHGTALQIAARKGFTHVVRILLEAGADVNTTGGKRTTLQNPSLTALEAAAEHGSMEILQMLLNAGADVNAPGGECGHALQSATCSYRGSADMLKVLLDAGAEVNALGGKYGNALQAAACGGKEKDAKGMMQLLLDAGAEPNAQGGCFGNALQAAAYAGNRDGVEMLLKAGSNVNAEGGEFNSTAIQTAAYHGHEHVVARLISAGADVNAQSGDWYGSALQNAAQQGHEQITQMLLAAGADVNAEVEGELINALQLALDIPHEGIVRKLLDAGADVNAKGGKYCTALQLASYMDRGDRSRQGRHERIVQMLLDAGADVNIQGGRYGTALQSAVLGRSEWTVRRLLDAGAEVNAQCGTYTNALHAARMSGGSLSIVQMLLEAGARY